MPALKDARWERERRWLVDMALFLEGSPTSESPPRSSRVDISFGPSRTLLDRYLSCGRLRLREDTDAAGQRRFKLTKKFATESPHERRLVTIDLDEAEFEALYALDGHDLRKSRHRLDHGGHVFSLDLFDSALFGLVLLEVEAESLDALMRIEPPSWVRAEVTEDAFFTGGVLCRVDAERLAATLRRWSVWSP